MGHNASMAARRFFLRSAKRPWGTLTAVAVVVLAICAPLGHGCRSVESEARQHLESEGLDEVALSAVAGDSNAFHYTANLALATCKGRVSVERHRGSLKIIDHMSCRPDPANCSTERPTTCFRLGMIGRDGDQDDVDVTPVDHGDARGYFDIACLGGHARACNALGLEYALPTKQTAKEPIHDSHDLGRAHQAFERSCALDYAKGCFNLALNHHYGRGVPVDEARAVHLYGRACSRHLTSACYNLGVCRRDGVGAPRDPASAAKAFGHACSRDHQLACVNLAVMHATGAGGPRDTGRARRLLQHACDRGVDEGCKGLRQLPPG
jgi:TPR repeat protein